MFVLCTEPLCVVMELATNGSLQRLLRRQRYPADDNEVSDHHYGDAVPHCNLTSSDLLLFALHVASGMEYIASQRVGVHFVTVLICVECMT